MTLEINFKGCKAYLHTDIIDVFLCVPFGILNFGFERCSLCYDIFYLTSGEDVI